MPHVDPEAHPEHTHTGGGQQSFPDAVDGPDHGPVPDGGSARAPGAGAEQNSVESEADSPQPEPANGVDKDMATVVLNPSALDSRLLQTPGAASAAAVRPGDWASLSDSDIMLRVREGDDEGFNYLIEKYRRPIVHFMFRMVHNQAVAEELAQEVFLRVYRSRQTYRAEARFTTWLYRIATNLGVNHARDTKHERTAQNVYLDQPDAETGIAPDLPDPHATVEQDMVRNERLRAIRQQVLSLPERQRTAVLMHKYQGMDYKEIGAVLKLSESATKSLLFRAYQTLRERLKDFVAEN